MKPRNDGVYTAIILFVVFIAIVCGISYRARAHDIYSEWKQENGASCCNERKEHDGHVTGDCRRVKATPLSNGSYMVHVDGGDVLVTPDKVLKIPSPDMSAHWCGMGSVTFCFVPADTGI